jgi:hypothetical protein
METTFKEVAKNLVESLKRQQKNYHPEYTGGWKICRHGVGEAFGVIQMHPKVSDIKLIHFELEQITQQEEADRNLMSALKNALNTFQIIITLFKESDIIRINTGEKSKCYNYTYYACRFKPNNEGDGGRYLDGNIYPIAVDSYGTDCIRLPEIGSAEEALSCAASLVEKANQEKQARVEKFKEFSETVKEKYGEKILKLATNRKEKVLAVLSLLANNQSDISKAEIEKILKLGGDSATIENLFIIVEAGLDPWKAEKVVGKAYAWAYLKDNFPGIKFVRYFDSALSALEIYSKNWEYKNSQNSFTLGDIESLQKLKEKLA